MYLGHMGTWFEHLCWCVCRQGRIPDIHTRYSGHILYRPVIARTRELWRNGSLSSFERVRCDPCVVRARVSRVRSARSLGTTRLWTEQNKTLNLLVRDRCSSESGHKKCSALTSNLISRSPLLPRPGECSSLDGPWVVGFAYRRE